tara:strand:- start:6973 stop:8163 length:1191 start_codon:yes stop_codon:yes gene_type:complete
MIKSKEINFLVGNKNFKKKILKPYDEEICKFLSRLSKELNKIKDSNMYPDIKTLSFFCREKNIERLKNNFLKYDLNLRSGLGLLFHITPSNIPVNFAYSLIFGLLTGNSNIIKVPSNNFMQIKLICTVINKILKNNFKNIRDMINVVKYKDNDEFTKLISLKCDARIIWGGDNTIQKIRNFKINPRAFDLSFADRYSLSIINSKKFSHLKSSEVKKLLNKFYNDTYIVDQNACSSPHLVIWYGKIKKNTIEKFWSNLSEIVDKKYDLTEDMTMTKYTKLCKEIISNSNTSISKYKNNIYTIDLKKLSKDINNFRGVYGYFYQTKIKNLNYINKIINKKVQTLTYFGFNKNFFQKFFTNNFLQGIDRVVPIGQALDIDLIWDGYNLNSTLTRIIDIR